MSGVHHVTRVHHVWTDGDGHVGLGWDMLKELSGTRVYAAHEGNGVCSVHVVHDIEVAHLVIGGGAARGSRAWLQRGRDGAGRWDWNLPSPYFSGFSLVLPGEHASGGHSVAVLHVHVLVCAIEGLAKPKHKAPTCKRKRSWG